MLGTSKEEIKEFVEDVVANYKNSNGYAVICSLPEMQQDFINGKLYELYKEAQKGGEPETLEWLKQILEEYPGFSTYFAERQKDPQKGTPDLPWCSHVMDPVARKFWGLKTSD